MHLGGLRKELDPFFGSSFDTMVVLFFLGIELGRTMTQPSFDSLLLFVTTLMVLTLPYALLDATERPVFGKWLTGRGLVTAFAISSGMILDRSLGTVVPEGLRFLPLTLLIFAGMSSCFIQFYALMRLRLAK
jgi:hypothetical protein